MTNSDIHISLRDYVDVRVAAIEAKVMALRDQITLALASSDKAIVKSEAAADRRFESVNEFRSAMSDQSASFLPRTEFNVQHVALMNRIDAIDRALIEHKADMLKALSVSAGRQNGIGFVLTTIGAIATIAIAAMAVIINMIRH